MKGFWIVSLLLLGLLGGAAAAAPVISVDNPLYAASVQSGSLVTHTFLLKNAGDQILKITGVRTSCGCTTTTLAKTELTPGDSVGLEAVVNTSGFTGTVERTVTVQSNDPANVSLVLRLSITILAPVEVPPAQITVGDFQKLFYVLIDVRTPEEFATGHLLGAVNIPLSEFQQNLAAWTPRLPKDVPLIVTCLIGGRSGQATRILLQAGFANVRNLVGGITEWTNVFGPQYLFAF
jgi:rhodanese-related sulfurtransferase